MHAVGEADMTEIVWEMYKDASKDVDSIDELQYFVHRVDAVDCRSKSLVISKTLFIQFLQFIQFIHFTFSIA
jgi:hypothetical protein